MRRRFFECGKCSLVYTKSIVPTKARLCRRVLIASVRTRLWFVLTPSHEWFGTEKALERDYFMTGKLRGWSVVGFAAKLILYGFTSARGIAIWHSRQSAGEASGDGEHLGTSDTDNLSASLAGDTLYQEERGTRPLTRREGAAHSIHDTEYKLVTGIHSCQYARVYAP